MFNFIRNVALVLVILALATTLFTQAKTGTNIVNATVMITNMEGSSGGSGSVVSSNDFESEVLTNAHVCGVVVGGGLVVDVNGQASKVEAYKKDEIHDLCLIVVRSKLPATAKLSLKPGKRFAPAVASGHPALLPTTLSPGHVGDNREIGIFVGLKQCEKDDWKKSSDLCIFFGGIPIIKNYLATYLTTLIMPGSSGSAVYNADAELINVVFAGTSGLGFAFSVPYENVVLFLSKYSNGKMRETFTLPQPGKEADEMNTAKKHKIIESKCLTAKKEQLTAAVIQYCRILTTISLW